MMAGWFGRLLPALSAYPDIHPLLVHFPIVLFPVSLLLFFLSLRGYPEMIRAARLLFFLGVLGFIAAVLAGFYAQGRLANGPGTPVAAHRSFMLATAAAAGIAVLLELREKKAGTRKARWIFAGWLLVVNVLLLLGADRGAAVSLRSRGFEQGTNMGRVHSLLDAPPRPVPPDTDIRDSVRPSPDSLSDSQSSNGSP